MIKDWPHESHWYHWQQGLPYALVSRLVAQLYKHRRMVRVLGIPALVRVVPNGGQLTVNQAGDLLDAVQQGMAHQNVVDELSSATVNPGVTLVSRQ